MGNPFTNWSDWSEGFRPSKGPARLWATKLTQTPGTARGGRNVPSSDHAQHLNQRDFFCDQARFVSFVSSDDDDTSGVDSVSAQKGHLLRTVLGKRTRRSTVLLKKSRQIQKFPSVPHSPTCQK